MQKVHPKVLWDMRYTYIIYIYILVKKNGINLETDSQNNTKKRNYWVEEVLLWYFYLNNF